MNPSIPVYRIFSGVILPALLVLLAAVNCAGEREQYSAGATVPALSELSDEDRIRPYRNNPRYWQYLGSPVLLLGASDQDNLFNHPDIWPFGLESHLDLLVKNGGNYVRNTMSSRDPGNLWPFARGENGLYDLDQWNEEYWERFERFLQMTYERGIIVQIEIWDRFDYAREPWDLNPYNPANNVNYTSQESRLPERIATHPGQRESPFFRTPPDFEDNPLLLAYQRAHFDKILSIALRYPHVLYCISNETNESPLWSDYWAEIIHRRADEAGVTVQVTEMWDAWDLSDPEHDATFERPDLYSYVDVSQNTHQVGQTHWDNAQYVRNERLADGLRPMNNVKIYGGPRHGHSFEEGAHKLWRNIFGGFASSRFHRSGNVFQQFGLGLLPLAQNQIRSMRMFTDQMDVFTAEPSSHLLGDREENEAYAFAEEGRQYALFFPDGGSVTLDLRNADGTYRMRWLDVMNSRWLDDWIEEEGPVFREAIGRYAAGESWRQEQLRGGARVEVTAPWSGPWAVLLLRE